MRGRPLALLILASCIRNPKDLPGPQEGGFVEGVVVEQSLSTGDLAGVSGALISEISTNTRVTADSDGRFMLQRLPIGKSLYIDIRKPPAAGALSDRVRRLPAFKILVDGQIIDLDEIRLGENGALEGRVLLEQETGAPIAAGGTAVAIATTTFKGLTFEDGRYSIPSVPQGTFDIVAFRPGFIPARASGVSVSPAVTVQVRDLVMTPGEPPDVQVAGGATLFDAEDGGHSGTEVLFIDELDPNRQLGPAITGGDGSYSVAIPAGIYRVRITHDGYAPAELEGVAVLEEGVIGLLRVTLYDGESRPPPSDDPDGDGCPNDVDRFPNDPFGCLDNDSDSIPDEIDLDDDNDGLSDFEEGSVGLDGFVTHPLLADTDQDSFSDADDNCPTVPNPEQNREVCVVQTGNAPPMITSISPRIGKIGAPITVRGRNFVSGSITVVQFGDGAVASADSVASDRAVVSVPRGAASGPLTISTGGRVATSTDSFTVIAPPQISRVVPPSARANGALAVYGLDVENGDVFIGGVGTLPRGCTSEEQDLRRPGEEMVCARVAPGTATGRLEVSTTDAGPSFEAITFVVLSGPIIYEVRPNPAARGIPITIVGDGFETTDTSGAVTIEFTGAAAAATPTRLQNVAIDVVVPPDAITGPVRVVHPAGNTESLSALTIDDGSPLIYDFDHTLVASGDTLVILGRHLIGATAVTFAGGAAGTGITSADGQITVTVPNGVDPGPVTVTVAAGQATSSVRLAVLEVSQEAFIGNISFGTGLSADDQTLYALTYTSPPQLALIPTDLITPPTMVPVGGQTTVANFFAVSPDGMRGLITDGAQRVHVVELPSGALVGTCPRTPPTVGNADYFPPRFDDRSRYAFTKKPTDAPSTEEGFLRIDLTDGSCEYFVTATSPSGAGVAALLFDPFSGQLLVSHGTRGHMYVDPMTGLPTTALGLPMFGHSQLFRGLAGPGRIYAVGNPAANLIAADLFSGRPLSVIQAGTNLLASQTRNGRWLYLGPRTGTSPGSFVDLTTERVARSGVMPAVGEYTAAAISSFYIVTASGADEEIRRFTIRD
jgi:hypothetical protein